MNREEAKKWAELFTAAAEGEEIQKQVNGKWATVTSIQTYGHSPSRYRVKPGPVEVWVWYNPNPPDHLKNVIGADSDDAYWKAKGYTKIKVREVQD